MLYKVKYSNRAEEELWRHKKAGNKILVKKILLMEKEIADDPRDGMGKPKRLKYQEVETWSRKIDETHRMVYTIYKSNVIIQSLWGHYEDK